MLRENPSDYTAICSVYIEEKGGREMQTEVWKSQPLTVSASVQATHTHIWTHIYDTMHYFGLPPKFRIPQAL